MQIKGKVTYKGDIKKFKKGCGLGFKIEGFEEFLNVWGFNEEQLKAKTEFEVGDELDVSYELNEGFNSVKKIINTDENPLAQEIQTNKVEMTPCPAPTDLEMRKDLDIRKIALEMASVSLSFVKEKPESKIEFIEMAQFVEHYLRTGEKAEEFKQAG